MRLELAAVGIALAAAILAAAAFVAANRRDAPPPDLTGVLPPATRVVPATSNGWYLLREATRALRLPADRSREQAVWNGMARDPEAARLLLATNALALAWIDRTVCCETFAPPGLRLPEDENIFGTWAPVSVCGRLLRFRARWALADGRTNEALAGFAASLRLARLYLDCPPEREIDALAAFTEIRNALLGLRTADELIGARAVWDRFGADLRDLSDLSDARRRAVAMVLASDRRNLEQLRRIVAGEEEPPQRWGSPLSAILPDEKLLRQGSWMEQVAIPLLNRLPAGYRLQPNRTLATMAAIRCGRASVDEAHLRVMGMGRGRGPWETVFGPLLRLLGPNGLGQIYIMSEAGRQSFIDSGARVAETAVRGTRVVLALRLCEEERCALPDRLDALVPTWLETVPTDPYDGRPFRYDRRRRLVYSVGVNLRDDGGRNDRFGGDDLLFPVPP